MDSVWLLLRELSKAKTEDVWWCQEIKISDLSDSVCHLRCICSVCPHPRRFRPVTTELSNKVSRSMCWLTTNGDMFTTSLAPSRSIPHLSSRSLVLDEECRVALPVKQGQEYHIFHKRDASARPSKSELYSGWCFILRIAKQQTTSATNNECLSCLHLNYINL